MPSKERDVIDVFDDNSPQEDGTYFIPVPDGRPDKWTRFFCGLFMGIAGGALIPLGPWLGGALVLVGYGLVAHTIRGSSGRLGRGLCFGFAVSALVGALILAGSIFLPAMTSALIEFLGRHHAIFLGIIFMPWVAGAAKAFFSRKLPKAALKA
jgi:hypothetical protein